MKNNAFGRGRWSRIIIIQKKWKIRQHKINSIGSFKMAVKYRSDDRFMHYEKKKKIEREKTTNKSEKTKKKTKYMYLYACIYIFF